MFKSWLFHYIRKHINKEFLNTKVSTTPVEDKVYASAYTKYLRSVNKL